MRLIENFLAYFQTLYLSGGHSQSSGSITDRGLAAIAAGCPGMRRFSLRQAHKVTQAGVQVTPSFFIFILIYYYIIHLYFIHVYQHRYHLIYYEHQALLRGCPALQLLSLAGCDYLTGCVDLRGSGMPILIGLFSSFI